METKVNNSSLPKTIQWSYQRKIWARDLLWASSVCIGSGRHMLSLCPGCILFSLHVNREGAGLWPSQVWWAQRGCILNHVRHPWGWSQSQNVFRTQPPTLHVHEKGVTCDRGLLSHEEWVIYYWAVTGIVWFAAQRESLGCNFSVLLINLLNASRCGRLNWRRESEPMWVGDEQGNSYVAVCMILCCLRWRWEHELVVNCAWCL